MDHHHLPCSPSRPGTPLYFYTLALPHLYQDPFGIQRREDLRTSQLYRSLINNSDLCPLVRVYRNTSKKRSIPPPMIAAMVNVQEAHFHGFPAAFLRDCPSRSLRQVVVRHYFIDKDPEQENITTWLCQQVQLTDLEWDSFGGGTPNVPLNALCSLKKLIASAGVTGSFLVGRAIEVFISRMERWTPEDLNHLIPLFPDTLQTVYLCVKAKHLTCALTLLRTHAPKIAKIALGHMGRRRTVRLVFYG